jgi:4-hydroxybenzoate polyprenyltransferase
VKRLLIFFSWRHWGIVRYNSVWQNLSALFYVVLAERLFNLNLIGRVGIFFLFSTCMTAYGYLVNDLADMELDRLHGKSNAFHGMSRGQAVVIVLATLLLGSLFGLSFLNRPWFVPVWLLWILTATCYSLPPLRFKEHGLIGLMATIAAQQTLPTALLFATFGQLASWGALVFVLFSTVRGTSSDIGHQIRDWSHDVSTGTGTFAVQRGYSAIQRVYAVSLEAERLALGGVLVLLLFDLPPVVLPLLNWQMALAWPLALFYVLLYVLTAGRSWRALRVGCLENHDPYDEARQASTRDALHVIHHSFPSVLVPLYLALCMALFYWPNVVFVFVLGLLYGLYSPKRWAKARLFVRSLLAGRQAARSTREYGGGL